MAPSNIVRLHVSQNHGMRLILGVPRGISAKMMLHELQMLPLEHYLTNQTQKQQHSGIHNKQNNSIAMYGLLEKDDDVTKTVNKLLYEMNL